jgi:hypothetical protein
MIVSINRDYFCKSGKKLMMVMVTGCVLFEIRTEFLNIIQTNFGVKELNISVQGSYYSCSSNGRTQQSSDCEGALHKFVLDKYCSSTVLSNDIPTRIEPGAGLAQAV